MNYYCNCFIRILTFTNDSIDIINSVTNDLVYVISFGKDGM